MARRCVATQCGFKSTVVKNAEYGLGPSRTHEGNDLETSGLSLSCYLAITVYSQWQKASQVRFLGRGTLLTLFFHNVTSASFS